MDESSISGLIPPRLSDKLYAMKTVSLRTLRRESTILDEAAQGEDVLVTRFGKPYIRITATGKSNSFVGAGRHLNVSKPVTSDPILASEWKEFS